MSVYYGAHTKLYRVEKLITVTCKCGRGSVTFQDDSRNQKRLEYWIEETRRTGHTPVVFDKESRERIFSL